MYVLFIFVRFLVPTSLNFIGLNTSEHKRSAAISVIHLLRQLLLLPPVEDTP